MATRTAPIAALTKQEIRDLIDARVARYPMDAGPGLLARAVDSAFDVVGYIDLDAQGQYDFGERALSDVWTDLRPTELARLKELITESKERVQAAAWNLIVEEVVSVALRFGAEHPDAPRAEEEVRA